MRRSGLTLILAGLLGILFFWLTDPRYGYAQWWSPPANLVDVANEALVGTLVGVICSAAVLISGLWMIRRRTL